MRHFFKNLRRMDILGFAWPSEDGYNRPQRSPGMLNPLHPFSLQCRDTLLFLYEWDICERQHIRHCQEWFHNVLPHQVWNPAFDVTPAELITAWVNNNLTSYFTFVIKLSRWVRRECGQRISSGREETISPSEIVKSLYRNKCQTRVSIS